MEIISGRRNGKKQELLKKIEEMLDKHEIVLAFNSKQLQERDRQIRKQVCDEIRKFYTNPVYDRENSHTEVRVLLARLDQIEKGEINENNKETNI